MKHAVTFKLPVYKNQAVGANAGLIVEIGDSVDLVIDNGTAAPSVQAITLTGVFNGGTTLEWDASTTGNLRTEDVMRVHFRHNYNCPGSLNYQVVLTETDADTVSTVTSLELGSPAVAYTVGATGPSVTQAFVDELVAALNALLGSEGYASAVLAGVSGSQTITITINGLTVVPGDFVLVNLTAGAWSVV